MSELFYLSKLSESLVKSNAFLHSCARQVTHTHQNLICSMYCRKCFTMLKYIKSNVLFQFVGKTISVNFLVHNCPGAKLSVAKLSGAKLAYNDHL